MVIAKPIPVQALLLPDVPRKLQQVIMVNRMNLESAGMWEFLVWIRDVNKVVHKWKVANFVQIYQVKNKTARMGLITELWCASMLSCSFALPNGGVALGNLPDLKKIQADDIFDYNFRWGKETKWSFVNARHHWKAWFELMHIYLLFWPEENTMEQKYVVAVIRTWEGMKVDWANLVQTQINEEIQIRKVWLPRWSTCTLHLHFVSVWPYTLQGRCLVAEEIGRQRRILSGVSFGIGDWTPSS